jgi:hypothetical protein
MRSDGMGGDARSGAADDRQLDEIAERAGMRVVGPVPEGYL